MNNFVKEPIHIQKAQGRSAPAVILPAGGNPEEQSQPPVIFPLYPNGGQWVVLSLKAHPPPAVILGTPVITAFGCDNCGVGNPEERSQPPWAYTPQRGWRGTRRTSGITFVISTSNNGTVPFVPLDSRASSRMTARR